VQTLLTLGLCQLAAVFTAANYFGTGLQSTSSLWANEVKTSMARVVEYGRIMADGGKRRKRRKFARTTPSALKGVPPAPQPEPQITAPTSVQPATIGERGSRIARIRLLDRQIIFQMAEEAVPRELFQTILKRIGRLKWAIAMSG
jgi:hypothetical protein